MNFISEPELVNECVELKYCERCGGLFLRGVGASVVHCSGCLCRATAGPILEKTETTEKWDRRRPVRLSRGPRKDGHELRAMATIVLLQAVALEVRSC